MIRIEEQTDEEKLAMYMKCKKKELALMLIECNRILDDTLSAQPYSRGEYIEGDGGITYFKDEDGSVSYA